MTSMNKEGTGSLPVKWVLVGLLSHSAWGGYPVFARYLQTVGGMPTLLLGGMANGIAAVALLFFVIPKMKRSRPDWRVFGIFGVVLVLRALTNMYSARFTSAVNVQLISLMTPFLVAGLSSSLLGERLPRHTAPALLLSICGAVLMVTAKLGRGGVSLTLGPSDWIGIGLALASTVLLALYMILIRKVMRSSVPAETLVVFQTAVLFVFMNGASLLFREDWGILGRMPPSSWAALLFYGLGIILTGTMLQNTALRHIRASFYTVMLAWRLVGTTVMAALVLGERFTSVWQGIGAIVVMATVTGYSLSQNRPKAASSAA